MEKNNNSQVLLEYIYVSQQLWYPNFRISPWSYIQKEEQEGGRLSFYGGGPQRVVKPIWRLDEC